MVARDDREHRLLCRARRTRKWTSSNSRSATSGGDPSRPGHRQVRDRPEYLTPNDRAGRTPSGQGRCSARVARGRHALPPARSAGGTDLPPVPCVAAPELDATLVRVLLTPSLMGLLGRYNWWPSALHRDDDLLAADAKATVSPSVSSDRYSNGARPTPPLRERCPRNAPDPPGADNARLGGPRSAVRCGMPGRSGVRVSAGDHGGR